MGVSDRFSKRFRKIYHSAIGLVLTVSLAGVLAACGSTSSSAPTSNKPVSGGTLTFAEQPGLPPNYIFPLYDGADSGNNNITYLQPLMWLPLYWFGHAHSAAPTVNYRLSMAHPPVFSNGNKTITIKLKHYMWSDGKPVTSRDILFWMNELLAEKLNYALYVPGGILDHISSMSAPSPYTFVLNTNIAYNPTYMLYNGLSLITPMPQQAWDKTSASGKVGNYDETPAGARAVYNYLNKASMSLSTWDTNPLWQVVDGPWHLKPNTGFQVTGQTIMVPNKAFSGPDKPHLSEFEELPFTTDEAEYNELRSGGVDYGYVPEIDVSTISGLKSDGMQIKPWYEWGDTFIGINFANPKYAPLYSQLYIRQAMQHLIDETAYIKYFLHGYGTPDYGPVPVFPNSDFLSKAASADPYQYSVSDARRLLTSHGWTIPASGPASCARPGSAADECGTGITAGATLSLPLLYVTGVPTIKSEIVAMQSAFMKAGIALNLQGAPESTVLTDSYECLGKTTKTCPVNSSALSIISSPVYTFVPIYYPDGGGLFACGGDTNGGDYCNSQVDTLINDVRTNPSSSMAPMYALEDTLAKQVPVLWFPNSAYQVSAIAKNVGGVTAQDSTGHIYPQDWWVK